MSAFPAPSADLDPAQLAAILRWYADMGIDLAIDDAPRDRFADWAQESARIATQVPPPTEAGTKRALPPRNAQLAASVRIVDPAAAQSQDEAAKSARERARSAASLDELRAVLESFDGCALKRTATQLVFADGNPQAKVMFVGEAPGADEDRQGLPFVGKAGQLLNRMLAAIGHERSSVYITNVVPWRPPGNRTPTPQETAVCMPFIARQIELVNPQVLVCLGAAATQTLLGVKEGIMRARGHWFEYGLEGGNSVRTMPTLHPAYLLRSSSAKRLIWRDLREIRKALTD